MTDIARTFNLSTKVCSNNCLSTSDSCEVAVAAENGIQIMVLPCIIAHLTVVGDKLVIKFPFGMCQMLFRHIVISRLNKPRDVRN